MVESSQEAKLSVSAIELLSMAGYAFLIGWMFVSFFWLFCDFPPSVPIEVRDFTQLWAFIGIPIGYIALHIAGRFPQFNPFSLSFFVVDLVLGLVLPVVAFTMYSGSSLPLPLVCVSNFLAGLSFSFLNIAWLDVLSRLKTDRYGRFTGFSFICGGVLFGLAALSPFSVQPAFSLIYIFATVGLLYYATKHAEGNDERAPLENTADTWKFSREVEPSLLMFGVVFALTFVYLFNYGQDHVIVGLISVFPGALIIAALSIFHHEMGITSIQRILTFVTVAACIIMPFTDGLIFQLICSCVVVAAWAMLTCVNSAFIVKKSALARQTPFFRQAPAKLAVAALGFAIGWGIATAVTVVTGAHSETFTFVRLVTAIVLVAVAMVFFPVQEHHHVDGSSPDASRATTLVSVQLSEQELFEARCEAVTKLYQLSTRESEILRYLARGRNAAYIQEKLTISPHTVKSHIYNIYRKLDIHSQQKLMDFVEEFPLNPKDMPKK